MTPPFEFSLWTDMRPAPAKPDYRRHYAEVLEEAKLADQLGFRAVWTSELHGVDDGYLGAQFPALAGIATVTTHLRLVTGILVLPFYNWRQILENAVVVDLLSQGRLELGVAAGAYEREFQLFGADMRRRGRLTEEGIRFLRQGLVEGSVPDGPGGEQVTLTPPPVQERVPILVGGLVQPAVDRAVRLGDGHIAYEWEQPDVNIPLHWENVLRPALDQHSRSLEDFRFLMSAPLWVSDDPEKDWKELYEPAFRYQQAKYNQWYGGTPDPGLADQTTMEAQFVGPPDDVARRLVDTWKRAPWHEFGFFHRLPGIPHDRALEQIEMVSSRLVPAIRALTQDLTHARGST